MKVVLVGRQIREELQKLPIPFNNTLINHVKQTMAEVLLDMLLPKLKNFQLLSIKVYRYKLSILNTYGQVGL